MDRLHFNAKVMREMRSKIAKQDAEIDKARVIMGIAEDEKMCDRIVGRIFALLSEIIAYKKTQSSCVRVILDIHWVIYEHFTRGIVYKIKKAGFECHASTVGKECQMEATYRHAYSLERKHVVRSHKDILEFVSSSTCDPPEETHSLPVIMILNTWDDSPLEEAGDSTPTVEEFHARCMEDI